jgi:hypothetical protein
MFKHRIQNRENLRMQESYVQPLRLTLSDVPSIGV